MVHCEVAHGAVLFADASGFTKLTELLAKGQSKEEPAPGGGGGEGTAKGAGKGAEILCQILNSFYKELVDIVVAHGGDIIKFAGDAVTVVWFTDSESKKDPFCPDMATACRRACECSLELHQKLHEWVAVSKQDAQQYGGGDKALTLSLHCGVGCGELTCIHVGGVFRRWEYVIAGPAISQIAVAEPLAVSGETVMSPEVWEHVNVYIDGLPLSDLEDEKRQAKMTLSDHRYVIVGVVKQSCIKKGAEPWTDNIHNQNTLIDFMKRYIPAAVHKELEAGNDTRSLAEIRVVSLVFLQINGVNLQAMQTADGRADALPSLVTGQDLMLNVQEIMYSFEGSVNKMTIDDKGLVFLCVFGLYPLIHADDPKRAVNAARMAIDRLPKLLPGITVSVGVTTGPTFCGVVGSSLRREYTVMGMLVNLAARLMCSAPDNGVLVDERTQSHSSAAEINMELHAELELKGIEKKQPCYKPVNNPVNANDGEKKKKKAKPGAGLMKEARTDQIKQIKRILTSDIKGQVCVIIGDRGSGKSDVFKETVALGKKHGFVVLDGKAKKAKDSTLKALSLVAPGEGATTDNFMTPKYLAWEPIFNSMLDLLVERTGLADKTEVVQHVLEGYEHLSLLAVMMPELQLFAPKRPDEDDNDPMSVSGIYDMQASFFGTPQTVARAQSSIFDYADTAKLDADIAAISYWQLNIKERISVMNNFLRILLQYFTEEEDALILLHFVQGTDAMGSQDAESWVFADLVLKEICADRAEGMKKVILTIINRPSVFSSPPEYKAIQQHAEKEKTLVKLGALGEFERRTYLRKYISLFVSFAPEAEKGKPIEIPESFDSFISSVGAGNPKAIQELVDQAIKEKAFVMDESGKKIKAGVDGLLQLDPKKMDEGWTFAIDMKIPDKTRNAMDQLLDALLPVPRQLVKYSCSWTAFSSAMLYEVLPTENRIPRQELPSILHELVDCGILNEVRKPDPGSSAASTSIGVAWQAAYEFHPDESNTHFFKYGSTLLQNQAKSRLTAEIIKHMADRMAIMNDRRDKQNETRQSAMALRARAARWLDINLSAEDWAAGRINRLHATEEQWESAVDAGVLPLRRRKGGFRVSKDFSKVAEEASFAASLADDSSTSIASASVDTPSTEDLRWSRNTPSGRGSSLKPPNPLLWADGMVDIPSSPMQSMGDGRRSAMSTPMHGRGGPLTQSTPMQVGVLGSPIGLEFTPSTTAGGAVRPETIGGRGAEEDADDDAAPPSYFGSSKTSAPYIRLDGALCLVEESSVDSAAIEREFVRYPSENVSISAQDGAERSKVPTKERDPNAVIVEGIKIGSVTSADSEIDSLISRRLSHNVREQWSTPESLGKNLPRRRSAEESHHSRNLERDDTNPYRSSHALDDVLLKERIGRRSSDSFLEIDEERHSRGVLRNRSSTTQGSRPAGLEFLEEDGKTSYGMPAPPTPQIIAPTLPPTPDNVRSMTAPNLPATPQMLAPVLPPTPNIAPPSLFSNSSLFGTVQTIPRVPAAAAAAAMPGVVPTRPVNLSDTVATGRLIANLEEQVSLLQLELEKERALREHVESRLRYAETVLNGVVPKSDGNRRTPRVSPLVSRKVFVGSASATPIASPTRAGKVPDAPLEPPPTLQFNDDEWLAPGTTSLDIPESNV